MRSVTFLFLFFSTSFCDLDLNLKVGNFSLELWYRTAQEYDDVVISPYAVWSLLTSVGYETSGVTREQVEQVFPLTDRSEFVDEFRKLRSSMLVFGDGVHVTLNNFLFYDERLKVHSESIGRLRSDFLFETDHLRFDDPKRAAASSIQAMRSRVTPMSFLRGADFADTTMIMCNAISFNAYWARDLTFNVITLNVTDAIQEDYVDINDDYDVGAVEWDDRISVVHVKARLRSSVFESLHASVTELPYENAKYCMLVVRPHSGYDVKQVSRNLRLTSLKEILERLESDASQFGLREVEVKLPAGITSHVVLNAPLSVMGLSGVFDEYSADFDNLAEDTMFIGEIAHRVTVKISEYNTVVHSAIPAYEFKGRTNPKELLVAKDSFIFFIVEKTTATILFGGSYSITRF